MKKIYISYKVYTTCEVVEEVSDEVYEELLIEAEAKGEMPTFSKLESDIIANEWDYVSDSCEIYDEDGNCIINH